MPLTYSEVAKQLNDILDRSGNSIVTVPWDTAYSMSGTKRSTNKRTDEICEAAAAEHGIIVTWGDIGLFIMKDENFAPAMI